jgi:hypothetical protein
MKNEATKHQKTPTPNFDGVGVKEKPGTGKIRQPPKDGAIVRKLF